MTTIRHGDFTFEHVSGNSWNVFWNGQYFAHVSYAAVLRAITAR